MGRLKQNKEEQLRDGSGTGTVKVAVRCRGKGLLPDALFNFCIEWFSPALLIPSRQLLMADGDGRIDVGDTFLVRRTDGRMFFPQTYLNIVNGSTLQSLSIHTSCSQPLNIGDQFGSVIIRSYQPKQ